MPVQGEWTPDREPMKGLTWGVNNVDIVVPLCKVDLVPDGPVAKGGGGLDGDALLSFEFHVVHFCTDRISASDFMNGFNSAGVEEHALRQCRLARAARKSVLSCVCASGPIEKRLLTRYAR